MRLRTRTIRLAILLLISILVGGCVPSDEPTISELLDGIAADPVTFELVVNECTPTVGSHIDYELALTNLDDKPRAFMIDIMVKGVDGEFRNVTRDMPEWIDGGETLPIKSWLGWDDAYGETPVCDFVVLRSSLEADR